MDITQIKDAANVCRILQARLRASIVGQPELIFTLMVGTLTGRPVGITGVPGVSKSHGAKVLGKAIGGGDDAYKRIQVMADMLPSDFTGGRIYDLNSGKWTFEHGPLFANVVHLDEFNRVGGRALSGVLEVMEERQVSIAGETHYAPQGQVILATFNPIESAGTEDLPDAVIDRFIMQVALNRLPKADMKVMGQRFFKRELTPSDEPGIGMDWLLALQALTFDIAGNSSEATFSYAADLVYKTMESDKFERDAGERAMLSLVHVAAAQALMDERATADIEDVKAIAGTVLRHRVLLKPEYVFGTNKLTVDQAIEELI